MKGYLHDGRITAHRVFIHNVDFDLDGPFIKTVANYIYVISIEGKLSGKRQQFELRNDCKHPEFNYEAIGIRSTYDSAHD